jgi:putative ABC transport system substrate-binding protein
MIRRRDFITLLGGAAAWPLAARAQQGGRMRRIGVLIGGDEGDPERQAYVAAFRETLGRLGWVEGRNVSIDWRWSATDASRARSHAAELLALNPDLLFGDNSFVLAELQQVTHTVPIVFARINDPIANGFVGSLSRPGGNITGFSDGEPSALIGLQFAIVRGPDPAEIENGILELTKGSNSGLITVSNALPAPHRRLIIELAARYKLPAIYSGPIWVTEGGLMSYGTDQIEQYRGAASYVDRILKGAKPTDLPVQRPSSIASWSI